MVKPLYTIDGESPDKKKRRLEREKAKKAYIISLCKNPYLISLAVILLVCIGVVTIHFYNRSNRVLNASSGLGGKKDGSLSFLRSSKYFNSKTKDIGAAQREQLKDMGINEKVDSLGTKIVAKDLREERKLLAIRKYEAVFQTAERRVQERKEKKERLQTATALQLKDAVMAVEESDSPLGIMRLESLLDEKLRLHGGDSQDADVLIYASDCLARAYQKRGMDEKAKEAYINAFRLMKSQAPNEQGSDWDSAIRDIEQVKTKTSR